MTSVDAIRDLLRHCQTMVETVMQDVSVEHANWLPPGTANSIGLTYLHLLNYQDHYVNAMSQGKQTIWVRDSWEGKLGHPDAMKMSREAAQERRIDPAAVRPYAEAVFVDTSTYLSDISEDELSREVQGYRGMVPVSTVLTRMAAFHTTSHLGEICALKGVQGLKGLPF